MYGWYRYKHAVTPTPWDVQGGIFTLKHLAKGAIRDHLVKVRNVENIPEAIEYLPIPTILKVFMHYILLFKTNRYLEEEGPVQVVLERFEWWG